MQSEDNTKTLQDIRLHIEYRPTKDGQLERKCHLAGVLNLRFKVPTFPLPVTVMQYKGQTFF